MDHHAILVTALDLGDPLGPSVAVKDCIDIAGCPTRTGSGALLDRAPASVHADVVEHVLAGGGHIIGKANMHELAYGITGINHAFGTPANPYYPELITGGSSSGSAAAVAAGLAQIAIGSDTGGSIRMPAACCGVQGLKPTFGRVSRRGCEPAASTLDCIGPFARDIAGLERGMQLIDPAYRPVSTPAAVRLGRVAARADAGIDRTVDAMLSRTGAAVVPRELPLLEEAFAAGMAIIAAESWTAFGALIDKPGMGDDVRARLEAASKISSRQLDEAETLRAAFAAAVDAALQNVDALALPTLPTLPPTPAELADAGTVLRLTALVRPFNLSGHPALTVPAGELLGRPVGLQLVGRKGGDAQLCALARALMQGAA